MTNPPRVEPRINVNCIITPILHPLQSRPDDFCSATYPQQPHGIIERDNSMKQFSTIEKLDTCILYILELASSLSVLLLAFGLIASMANVLTKGSVLTDNLFMQRVWAWTQCIAIDASVAGTIIRTFHYHSEGERVKTWLYGLLSVLLLFTAAIVSNIEAVQQTLSVTLDTAYIHVFIPVEVLTWIRSISVVLIIVAHGSLCYSRRGGVRQTTGSG